MAKRSRCTFVLAVLVACACRYGYGQEAPSSAAIQHVQHGAGVAARLSVECTANSASIAVGHLSVIHAVGVSPAGRPLRYSFGADAGQVVATGDTAEFRTVGVSPGVVQVTCTVMDDLGNSASKRVAVTVRSASARPVTPPPPPPAPTQATTTAPQQGETITRPKRVQTAPAAPVPAPVPAPAKAVGQGGVSGSAVGEYQQGTAVEQWKKGLKTGKIEYQVPTRMLMQQASTVTVVIHGYEDVGTTSLPGATGTGSLKQSERMKVELLAPDHPDDFTIVAQGGDAVRFVPIDGAATWMWSVTPNSGTEAAATGSGFGDLSGRR